MDIYKLHHGYFPKLRLLNSDGEDIAHVLRKFRDESVPHSGIGTAEVFMIDIVCIIILIIGYIIARYYWECGKEKK